MSGSRATSARIIWATNWGFDGGGGEGGAAPPSHPSTHTLSHVRSHGIQGPVLYTCMYLDLYVRELKSRHVRSVTGLISILALELE